MIGTAFAQSGPISGGGDTLMGLLPIILMFVIMYFILIRPQMKKAKEHKTMLEAFRRATRSWPSACSARSTGSPTTT